MNEQQEQVDREQLGDRFRGALLGLAAGDAVGTTVEFSPRGSFPPVIDMVGGGPFGLEPGQWTDDTSMALCLATSLVEQDGFDAQDQMNRYLNWARHGYLSSNGVCFDIGMTVSDALNRYELTQEPFAGSTDPRSSGNGCLMRLAPVAMSFYPDVDAMGHYARESSRTTHGSELCLDACALFADVLHRALRGDDKSAVLPGAAQGQHFSTELESIARGEYRDKLETDIRGSGFVVDSLEAALWCFWKDDSFEASILRAANLGDDADTTAAICGQVAGAFYGESGIPPHWLMQLELRDEMRHLSDRLLESSIRRAKTAPSRRQR